MARTKQVGKRRTLLGKRDKKLVRVIQKRCACRTFVGGVKKNPFDMEVIKDIVVLVIYDWFICAGHTSYDAQSMANEIAGLISSSGAERGIVVRV